MNKEDIQLTYEVGVDTTRIANGLELAELLIADAFKYIAFYTDGCKACTAAVMNVFAARLFDAAPKNPDGSLVERMVLDFVQSTEENRLPAEMLHQSLMRPKLRALLDEAMQARIHDEEREDEELENEDVE